MIMSCSGLLTCAVHVVITGCVRCGAGKCEWQRAWSRLSCMKGCESAWHLRGAVCDKGFKMVFVVAQAYSLSHVHYVVFVLGSRCLLMGNLACLAFAPTLRFSCNCQASRLGLLRSKHVAPGANPLLPKKHGFMSTFHASRFTVHGTYTAHLFVRTNR